MIRIVGVTLLFIVVTHHIYNNAGVCDAMHVSKVQLRKCRCGVSPGGKQLCRRPLFPSNPAERRRLIKCLCSLKVLKLQEACKSWQHGFPISLI